jgi:hypothetical protein
MGRRLLQAMSPWAPAETMRLATVSILGVLLVCLGWWAAHREVALGRQVRWATLAVSGLIICGYGIVSWLMRAHWSIMQRRESLLPDTVVRRPDVSPDLPHTNGTAAVIVGPGGRLFHRHGCALTAGRGWGSIARSSALAEDRQPCGVCRP